MHTQPSASMSEGNRDLKVVYSSYREAARPEIIDAKAAHSDNELLAQIGYKAELKRKFSTLQVFGVAFSIMGLLPSIASMLSTGLQGGASSLVWGWFIASFFVLLAGLCMAEMASSLPTSGGLYFWTNFYAPQSVKVFLSFLIGNINSLALVGGLCSIDYGFATEVLAAVLVLKNGDFKITDPKTYGVFAACVVSHIAVTCLASDFVSRLQSFSIYCNCFLIALFFIAVPIGCKVNGVEFNSGSFIFGDVQNLTDWTPGWNWVLGGFAPAVWTIGAFDSCVHMSEEAKNASRGVPLGIVGSISACYVLGFFICIVIAACMGPDVDAIASTELGSPIAQIIYNALGHNWAIAFMALIAFCQWLMGASILVAISRQIWAFARDNGLPFSNIIKVVNKKLSTPLRAVYFGGIMGIIIGCLCLVGETASDALFSLSVVGNYISWGTPILLRLTTGKMKFVPGPFYLGDTFSQIVNWITIVYICFIVLMMLFPSTKHVDKETMNYTCVITFGCMILSAIYYVAVAKRVYHGPKSNLDEPDFYHEGDGVLEGQEIYVVSTATNVKSHRDEQCMLEAIKSGELKAVRSSEAQV